MSQALLLLAAPAWLLAVQYIFPRKIDWRFLRGIPTRNVGGDARLPSCQSQNLFQPVLQSVHSSRNNIIGSADSARRAGIHAARSPSNAIARTTPANINGSWGVA